MIRIFKDSKHKNKPKNEYIESIENRILFFFI